MPICARNHSSVTSGAGWRPSAYSALRQVIKTRNPENERVLPPPTARPAPALRPARSQSMSSFPLWPTATPPRQATSTSAPHARLGRRRSPLRAYANDTPQSIRPATWPSQHPRRARDRARPTAQRCAARPQRLLQLAIQAGERPTAPAIKSHTPGRTAPRVILSASTSAPEPQHPAMPAQAGRRSKAERAPASGHGGRKIPIWSPWVGFP
jgi:hypothetical protein